MSWIVDPKIKAFAEELIECAPDYFFSVAASSTGKYHPSYSLGPGGLVRHTKSASAILYELTSNLEMFNKYSQTQKDMMIVSIMAHDFFKHGLESIAGKYTVADHPVVCANFIRSNNKLCEMLDSDQIEFIAGCIESHMGQWNTKWNSTDEIMPKPKTGPQNLVHLADYLASRKFLVFDFGDDYYEPSKPEPEPKSEAASDPELEKLKAEIIERCKAKIDSGISNKDIYAMISTENNGNRNPNSITNSDVAHAVLAALENLGSQN